MIEAFRRRDGEAFTTAGEQLDEAFYCLEEPVTPDQAARIHQAQGLRAFFSDSRVNNPLAQKSWAALKTLQPEFAFPEGFVPLGHPLLQTFDASLSNGATVDFSEAPRGRWIVDGTDAKVVPADRAFVLQGFTRRGEVLHIGYHYGPDGLPKGVTREMRRKRARIAGTAVAGTLLAASAFFFGASVYTKNKIDNSSSRSDADAWRSRNQVYSGLALGLAGAGLTAGVVTWTVKW